MFLWSCVYGRQVKTADFLKNLFPFIFSYLKKAAKYGKIKY